MVDVEAFGKKGFDPKRWINEACELKPPEEDMEKYLAELELRLHLAAEDVEASLELDSSRALQRIPAAVQEIAHVQGDITGLKADVGRGLESVSGAAAAASANVALLVQLERVKSRMEAACSKLKEATELSAQLARVEAVFAEGDLPRIAQLLASIRAGLALVGDVPEFAGAPQRLQALEDRFQAMIEPAVGAALAARQADRVAALASLIADAGRESHLEAQYMAARLPMLQGLWDGFEGRGFAAWLPSFYAGVANALASEARWCSDALPDLHPHLVLQLLSSLFARIDKPFRTRLASALVQGTGSGGAGAIAALAGMLNAAQHFVEGVAQSLSREGASDVGALPAAVYAPLQSQLDRYGELESVAFAAELANAALPDAAAEDAEAAAPALGAAAAAMEAALSAALARCEAATKLAGLPELQLVADGELGAFLARLQGVVLELRLHYLPPSRAKSGPPAAAEDGGTAVLQLLGAAGAVLGRAGACQAAFLGAVGQLRGVVEAAAGAAAPLDAVTLRLQASQGRLLAELQAFVSAAGEADYQALPALAERAAAFQADTHALVYDVLMQKVRVALHGLAALPVWTAQEGGNAAGGALPSFSAYPQQHVTVAGEYLMMLPQTLEGLLGAPDQAGQPPVDAEWLDRVAAGAAQVYEGELRGVRQLSASGAAQLSADLDYFSNVLAALGVALPPALLTWQVAVGWDAAGFTDAAAAALEEGTADRETLQQVAAARGLAMPA